MISIEILQHIWLNRFIEGKLVIPVNMVLQVLSSVALSFILHSYTCSDNLAVCGLRSVPRRLWLLPHATGGKELITLSLKEVANTSHTLSYQCAWFFETSSTRVGLHVQPCDQVSVGGVLMPWKVSQNYPQRGSEDLEHLTWSSYRPGITK